MYINKTTVYYPQSLRKLAFFTFMATVLIIQSSTGVAHASQIVSQLIVELNEEKVKQQFIIEGNNDDFYVNLILPGGNRIEHDIEPGQGYLYIEAENKKTWIVQDARSGTYTFEVVSPVQQKFIVSTKDAVQRPVTTWISPQQQTIEVNSYDQLIALAWETHGDVRANMDKLVVYLTPVGGWNSIEVHQSDLVPQESVFTVPADISDGDYNLTIIADDRSSTPPEINPSVLLRVSRGGAGTSILLGQAYMRDQELIIEFEMLDGVQPPEHLTGRFYREGDSAGLLLEGTHEMLELMDMDRSGSESENHLYRWVAGRIADNGQYEGSFYGYTGNVFTTVVHVPSFEFQSRDWSRDLVEWSIDGELTNRQSVQVSIILSEDSTVEILDDGQFLYKQELKKTEGNKPHGFELDLSEGEHLFDVLLYDRYGNQNVYSKRLMVNHKPPLLEIIQPLAVHSNVPNDFASGYAELGSKLVVNGLEITPEEDGYFKVQGIGNALTVTLTDESGNTAEYVWRPHKKSYGWYWVGGLNVLIIAVTILIIGRLKRTRTNN